MAKPRHHLRPLSWVLPRDKKTSRRRKSGSRRWEVRSISARKGDSVSWKAPRDSDIAVWFPPGPQPVVGLKGFLIVKARRTSSRYKLRELSEKRKVYHYHVRVLKNDKFAQGGSEPELIIPPS